MNMNLKEIKIKQKENTKKKNKETTFNTLLWRPEGSHIILIIIIIMTMIYDIQKARTE